MAHTIVFSVIQLIDIVEKYDSFYIYTDISEVKLTKG